jgi:hypothetical protein
VRHVSYIFGSCLPVGRGSGAPRALQHRTLPHSRGGLCGCHVSSGSGSCLPDRNGSGTTTCPTTLDHASLLGGLRCRHSMLCEFMWIVGLRYITKGLASLPMQLDSHVFKARTHIPYAPDVRAMMGVQDVRTNGIIITYKTCGQGGYSTTLTVLATRMALLQRQAI